MTYCASRWPDAPPDAPVGDGAGRRSAALDRRADTIRQLSAACGETVAQTIARLAAEG
jgi:hypothetical protein